MSLENIIQKIIQDAEGEAHRIIREGTDKAEAIKREARKEAEARGAALIKEEERAGKLESHRIVTQARLEKKLNMLSLKKELVDEVLEQAFKIAGVENMSLTRTVILKDGEMQESYDKDRLKDEIRLKLENDIAEVLKI
jgi:vacuolar-type H+-ATPase subunit E/Vma4